MKKILVMVVAAMMATANANAQDVLQNEVSIAYGAGSNTDLVMSIVKGMFSGKQLSYWGPISAEYFHYNSGGRFAIGGIAVLSGCKWDDYNDAKSTYFTVLPSVKYKWVDKTYFGLYSKVAAGITVGADTGGKEDKTKVFFNWHVSGIGLEFGSAFRGFAELGMGEQGVILAGLRYKF